MAKYSDYSALSAATFASGDLFLVSDVSETLSKKVTAATLLEGVLRVASGPMVLASNVMSVGPNGAANPSFQVNGATASAATGVKVTGAAAAGGVAIAAISSGTDEAMTINAKGAGSVTIGNLSTGNTVIGNSGKTLTVAQSDGLVTIAAAGLTVTSGHVTLTSGNLVLTSGNATLTSGDLTLSSGNLKFASGGKLVDANSNELIIWPTTVASATNEFTISNAANGSAPTITASGSSDTHVSVDLVPKGTTSVVRARAMSVEKNTTSALTDSATLTIAQLLTGVIDGTPVSAASYALPTAANLVAGIANARVGDSFEFLVANHGADADAITVTAGGSTLFGTATVAQNAVRKFRIIVDNVTGSSEAYRCYGIG